MCQHLKDLKFLQKKFHIEYQSTDVQQLLKEAHQKKFDIISQ